MYKLYHYVHCPFCIRVRMAAGFLKLSFESIVLPYNDEATPLSLMNKKMLPIFEFADGDLSNESLDIIKRLDKDDLLKNSSSGEEELDSLLGKIGSDLHSLCMPYWMFTPEFNNESREYFQTKKEVKRGPFKKLIQDKEVYLKGLEKTLREVESKLTPFYKGNSLSIHDIMLASHLWCMYIFPEFQFSKKMHSYLQEVKAQTKFEYHEDFWK
jgi:glutaredoxin 2